MSYHVQRQRRNVAVRLPRRRGLGDAISDAIAQQIGSGGGTSQDSQCLDQANAASAPFDAKVVDISQNWNPTGFYTIADTRQIVNSVLAVVQQGYSALSSAAVQQASDVINEANAELSDASGKSLDYLNAATDAENKGIATLNAPGLKRWVVSTMQSASDAITTGAMVTCMQPWWVGAIAAFQTAFDAAWSVVKQIVGAVLKVGEIALKVPDAVDTVMTVASWALGLGLAYWAYTELFAAHSRNESGL